MHRFGIRLTLDKHTREGGRWDSGIGEDGRLTTRRWFDGISEKIEKWHYNCGSYNFSVVLTFSGITLEKIEQIGYGSGKSDCIGAAARKSELMNRLQNLANKLDRSKEELLDEAVHDLVRKYEQKE